MSDRDYRNETTTFHFDVEGQANPNFSHRNDWARACTFCRAAREGLCPAWASDLDPCDKPAGHAGRHFHRIPDGDRLGGTVQWGPVRRKAVSA